MNVRHEALAIHPERRSVTVKNLESGEVFEESCDKLLLSPGALPVKPSFDGIDSEKIFTLRTVEGFADTPDGIDVKLKDAPALHSDMVLLAIGAAPESTLTDADTLISLAGVASKQGRIAADSICGGDSRYKGGQGSSVIKRFDMTAASTGINELTAKSLGIDCDKVILSPMSHAGYASTTRCITARSSSKSPSPAEGTSNITENIIMRSITTLDLQYAHRFYGFKGEAQYLHGHTGVLTIEVEGMIKIVYDLLKERLHQVRLQKGIIKSSVEPANRRAQRFFIY